MTELPSHLIEIQVVQDLSTYIIIYPHFHIRTPSQHTLSTHPIKREHTLLTPPPPPPSPVHTVFIYLCHGTRVSASCFRTCFQLLHSAPNHPQCPYPILFWIQRTPGTFGDCRTVLPRDLCSHHLCQRDQRCGSHHATAIRLRMADRFTHTPPRHVPHP